MKPKTKAKTTSAKIKKKRYVCFSGAMTVEHEDGHVGTVADLKVGDRVQVATAHGAVAFDTVYLIGAAPNAEADVVELSTASGARLEVTPGHYVHVEDPMRPGNCCSYGTAKLAGQVVVGDRLFVHDGFSVVASKVNAVKNRTSTSGLFSAYMLSSLSTDLVGTAFLNSSIIVNGVAGTHFTEDMSLIETKGFAAADKTLDLVREIWHEDPRFSEALSRENNTVVSLISMQAMDIVMICSEDYVDGCPHDLVTAEASRILSIARSAMSNETMELFIQGIEACVRSQRGSRLLQAAAAIVTGQGGSIHRSVNLFVGSIVAWDDLPEILAYAIEDITEQIREPNRMHTVHAIAAVSGAVLMVGCLGLAIGCLCVSRMAFRYRRFYDEEEKEDNREPPSVSDIEAVSLGKCARELAVKS